MLMLDKDKSFSKSELVAKGMVESSCSKSGIMNKIIIVSLEILSLISVKILRPLDWDGVIILS